MLWRGTVRRILATGGVYVEIKRKRPGYEQGPCEVLEGVWTSGLLTAEGSAPGPYDGAPAHRHGVDKPLAVGDRVLLAEVEGDRDTLVVLGRLRG